MFSEKLKKLRISRNLTQRDMAQLLGYTAAASYQRVENGQTSLTISRLKQIAEILEVDYLEMLGGNKDPHELEKQNRLLKDANSELTRVIERNFESQKLTPEDLRFCDTFKVMHIVKNHPQHRDGLWEHLQTKKIPDYSKSQAQNKAAAIKEFIIWTKRKQIDISFIDLSRVDWDVLLTDLMVI